MPEQALGGFGLTLGDNPVEVSCSYLASSSALGGFITPVDWVKLGLSLARFAGWVIFWTFL